MENNKPANGQAAQVNITPGTPAKKETAGDQIEEDNERKLGKDPGDKKDKTGR